MEAVRLAPETRVFRIIGRPWNFDPGTCVGILTYEGSLEVLFEKTIKR